MKQAYSYFTKTLEDIAASGLTKNERPITTPQSAHIKTADGRSLINLCSNNYLGLGDSKRVIDAAKKGMDEYGYGLSSVRFICGTQTLHKALEEKMSKFLGTDDTILFSSCFDANGGLFETLLTADDAVISDELNHASIIDGIRLCKAKRFRYKNNDMTDLREKLIEAKDARIRLIATDGVFSMDGITANLKAICDLADEFDALVMVDDSHAIGFMGEHGRGTPEHCGVEGRVDILTGTFGKALGGASGGYISARKPIIDMLRQKARPYLFSNTLAPAITAGSIEVINMLEEDTETRKKLFKNTALFRELIKKSGFDIIDGETPIIPIMLYDEHKAAALATEMYSRGIYVTAFSYPVVPLGKARIRTQMSAALSEDDIRFAAEQFAEAYKKLF